MLQHMVVQCWLALTYSQGSYSMSHMEDAVLNLHFMDVKPSCNCILTAHKNVCKEGQRWLHEDKRFTFPLVRLSRTLEGRG